MFIKFRIIWFLKTYNLQPNAYPPATPEQTHSCDGGRGNLLVLIFFIYAVELCHQIFFQTIMSKIFLTFSLGILTAILSGTGFPIGWKTFFFAIIGITVSIISLLIRKEINSLRRALRSKEHTVTDSFVQNSHIDTYGRASQVASEGHIKKINKLNPLFKKVYLNVLFSWYAPRLRPCWPCHKCQYGYSGQRNQWPYALCSLMLGGEN